MALFIGSFNPPTKAHLLISLKLHEEFKKIIFIPVNSKRKNLVNMINRLEMLLIYHRKYSFIIVDDIMKDYSFFDYRILDILKNKYHDNNIIIGSDLLKELCNYDQYEYILKNYNIYVIVRDNENVLKIINNTFYKYIDKFKIINLDIPISSTMVRMMIKKQEKLEDVLDNDIISYIHEKHLYF